MMLKKLGFTEIAAAILHTLRKHTKYPCYDAVPENAPSPLIFVEIVNKQDSSTKTMYKETFTAYLHAIAAPSDCRTEIYTMIHDIEETLTERIVLPPGVTNILQTETGVQALQQDETGEFHAVLGYEIMVSYGFKTKI